jgi:hypothetical protein
MPEQLMRIAARASKRDALTRDGTPRNDISVAVDIICAARSIRGTDAYQVLVEAADHSRMTVGEFARFMVRGLGT